MIVGPRLLIRESQLRMAFQRCFSSSSLAFRISRRFASITLLFLLLAWMPQLGICQTPPSKEKVDLLISGGTVVTMDADRRILEGGAIAVRGDTILAIGPRTQLETRYTPAQRIDATGKLIIPGLINGHTHAAMTLFRGIADDLNLQDWLTKFIFPAEARNVTADFVAWGTRLGALEMIHGGTTTYVDMYYFEDEVARATKQAGMRGILGETLLDLPAPDNKTTKQGLAYTKNFLSRWKGDSLIRPAVAPHSIYTASENTLKASAALARQHGAPIVIHVSETKTEVSDSRKKNGVSPVAYLYRIGLLGPDVIAAHCTWVDAEDIRKLAQKNVGCVYNPSSNAMLASGVAPVQNLLRAGVALGLGTDGPAGSNNDLDLMEEMDLGAKLQKVTQMDPLALGAKQTFEMATIGGARAIHMEKEIGSLEPGKKADLAILNLDAPHAVPLYDVYSQLAYALKASDVETVVIGGRTVMRNRRVLSIDETETIAKARAIGLTVKRSLAQPSP
jgi:5-methylthioadenosine/S-adenosylhomocysteine deaminase